MRLYLFVDIEGECWWVDREELGRIVDRVERVWSLLLSTIDMRPRLPLHFKSLHKYFGAQIRVTFPTCLRNNARSKQQK